MKFHLSLFVLIMAICTGCGSEREYFYAEELYGSYLAHYADDTDKLEINADGTYIHKYREENEVKEEKGAWKFVETPSDSVVEIDVVFYNFKFRAMNGISSSRGDWFTLAVKTSENKEPNIHLCFQTELHLCFVKE